MTHHRSSAVTHRRRPSPRMILHCSTVSIHRAICSGHHWPSFRSDGPSPLVISHPYHCSSSGKMVISRHLASPPVTTRLCPSHFPIEKLNSGRHLPSSRVTANCEYQPASEYLGQQHHLPNTSPHAIFASYLQNLILFNFFKKFISLFDLFWDKKT